MFKNEKSAANTRVRIKCKRDNLSGYPFTTMLHCNYPITLIASASLSFCLEALLPLKKRYKLKNSIIPR